MTSEQLWWLLNFPNPVVFTVPEGEAQLSCLLAFLSNIFLSGSIRHWHEFFNLLQYCLSPQITRTRNDVPVRRKTLRTSWHRFKPTLSTAERNYNPHCLSLEILIRRPSVYTFLPILRLTRNVFPRGQLGMKTNRFTFMLACMVDGTELPPYIVFGGGGPCPKVGHFLVVFVFVLKQKGGWITTWCLIGLILYGGNIPGGLTKRDNSNLTLDALTYEVLFVPCFYDFNIALILNTIHDFCSMKSVHNCNYMISN